MAIQPGFLLAIYLLTTCAHAQETDQYSVPPIPLEDMGAEIGREAMENLKEALQETWGSAKKLNAAEISRAIGKKLMTPFSAPVDLWTGKTESRLGRPISFSPPYQESAFYGMQSPLPFAFRFTAPTIRAFSVYFGTDKLDHFFKHGLEYYEEYREAIEEGRGIDEAMRRAVQVGINQEHGFWGQLSSGVYSNGDLAADFGGFQLLRNLTESIELGGLRYPPLLFQSALGDWVLRADVKAATFLKPFFTDRLNEALNPSVYVHDLKRLKAGIRSKCDSFLRFYGYTNDSMGSVLESYMESLRTWSGIDYGALLPETSVMTECF